MTKQAALSLLCLPSSSLGSLGFCSSLPLSSGILHDLLKSDFAENRFLGRDLSPHALIWQVSTLSLISSALRLRNGTDLYLGLQENSVPIYSVKKEDCILALFKLVLIFFKKAVSVTWRDDSVVKSKGCSCGRLEFCSRHQHWDAHHRL